MSSEEYEIQGAMLVINLPGITEDDESMVVAASWSQSA